MGDYTCWVCNKSVYGDTLLNPAPRCRICGNVVCSACCRDGLCKICRVKLGQG